MKKVAYITSGKIGIPRFTFNELVLLKQHEVDFVLCLTQLRKGPCMPKSDWHTITAQKKVALIQLIGLMAVNSKAQNLFFESIKKGVLPYFLMALSFYRELRESNITSIHCQMGDDKLYIGYFLKILMKLPLTVTVHAHELYKRKVYDDNQEIRRLYNYCDRVLTISEFNSEILMDQFGIPKEKLEIMRLFPDIDEMNYVRNKTKILIVANWAEKKGYDTLLQSLQKLRKEEFVLWVVGETYFSENSIDVRSLVKKYGLEDKVAILGRQSSPILDILFYACDIFCLPSYTEYYDDGKPAEREGIPVALMEAMAWGKPVIATKHAGNHELIKRILVGEKNVDELTEALSFLINNKAERESMGIENQKTVEKKFSKKNIEIFINSLNNL